MSFPHKHLTCSVHIGDGPFQSAQAAIIEHHRLGGVNSRFYSFTVLEARSPRSRSRQGWFLVRPLFLACRRLPSAYVFTWLFLCACTLLVSPPLLIRMSVLSDHSPTLLTSFKCNPLFKGSVSKYNHFGV